MSPQIKPNNQNTTDMKKRLPNQLTIAQGRIAIANRTAVHVTCYTGRMVHGYSETVEGVYASKADAEREAQAAGFSSFNLYGWNGSHWSTESLPA